MEKNLSDTLIGNGACFLAYLIFSFNILFCKDIANCGMVSPIALFCMRSVGALALFRLFSLLSGNKERIDKSDMWKVALASFLGLFLTQFSFLKAITMCTAVDVSILSLLSPVMTMVIAAIALKDRITGKGVAGLAISLAGVLFIVLNSVSGKSGASSTSVWGVLLMILNTASFGCYVGIFKPLIKKYSVVTFMKWMFLFSSVYALPFGIKDLVTIPYSQLPSNIVWQILYVVILATFVSYFLIPIGQKRIKPMIVCMYSYLQPVIAMAIGFAAGTDTITLTKGIATVCVFIGVGIVNSAPLSSQGDRCQAQEPRR